MQKSEVLKEVAETVKTHPIVMYVKGTKEKPQCGFSAATIELFKRLGKPFETVDILSRPELREFVPDYSEWPTFPQVFIGGKFVGGCDIVHDMNEAGELLPLVEAAFKS